MYEGVGGAEEGGDGDEEERVGEETSKATDEAATGATRGRHRRSITLWYVVLQLAIFRFARWGDGWLVCCATTGGSAEGGVDGGLGTWKHLTGTHL